ncbi:MAG: hypothetical protein QF737_05245, partial [Dehalococcoidales bacterium]|nr:hypothetical protein [Dehalococcoidales bacterium]
DMANQWDKMLLYEGRDAVQKVFSRLHTAGKSLGYNKKEMWSKGGESWHKELGDIASAMARHSKTGGVTPWDYLHGEQDDSPAGTQINQAASWSGGPDMEHMLVEIDREELSVVSALRNKHSTEARAIAQQLHGNTVGLPRSASGKRNLTQDWSSMTEEERQKKAIDITASAGARVHGGQLQGETLRRGMMVGSVRQEVLSQFDEGGVGGDWDIRHGEGFAKTGGHVTEQMTFGSRQHKVAQKIM